MFETLWKSSQKTISVLEAEIYDYREQLSKNPTTKVEVTCEKFLFVKISLKFPFSATIPKKNIRSREKF